jgi:hypothetical protein
MPARTIKVDRTTEWGNPFKVGETVCHPVTDAPIDVTDKYHSISLFQLHLKTPVGKALAAKAKIKLAGLNLACWCNLGDACHADALLAVANESVKTRNVA